MAQNVAVGDLAPDFQLQNEDGKTIQLSELKGSWVVLYFYPRDLTPGCTTEALDFTAEKSKFDAANTTILGVSPDTVASHRKFCDKKSLQISLLSDPEKDMIQSYGVWQQKKMAGREYMGVVRTTLLIDDQGVIRHIWDKVRVKGHVDNVLSKLTEFQNAKP